MDINEGFKLIEECISLLQRGQDAFHLKVIKPELKNEPGKMRFRYKDPGAPAFHLLKCARVISAYNAALCLLREGYALEVGALNRMILESLFDLEYVQEGLTKDVMPEKQKEMLDAYFEEELPSPEELLSRHSKKPTIVRRKIYAEVARGLNPDNPDRTQKLIRLIEEVYSGYVHGAYPHTMELHEGVEGRFHTKGMPGTPRQIEHIRWTVKSMHQALNVFAKAAAAFGEEALTAALIEKRKELEQSAFYKRAG